MYTSEKGGRPIERVAGIEPAYPAWHAGALPLSYTRVLLAISCVRVPCRTRGIARIPSCSFGSRIGRNSETSGVLADVVDPVADIVAKRQDSDQQRGNCERHQRFCDDR